MLLWDLKHSEHVENYRLHILAQTPMAADFQGYLDERPLLTPWEQYCYDAFWELRAGCGGGWGPEPIRLSEILAWITLHEAPAGEMVARMVRAVDAVWLRDADAKLESQTKK